eukprot:403357194
MAHTDRHDHNFYMRNILNAYHSKPAKIKAFIDHSNKSIKDKLKADNYKQGGVNNQLQGGKLSDDNEKSVKYVGVIKKSERFIRKIEFQETLKSHRDYNYQNETENNRNHQKQKIENDEDFYLFSQTPISHHKYTTTNKNSQNKKNKSQSNQRTNGFLKYNKSGEGDAAIDEFILDRSMSKSPIKKYEMRLNGESDFDRLDLIKAQSQQALLTKRNQIQFSMLRLETVQSQNQNKGFTSQVQNRHLSHNQKTQQDLDQNQLLTVNSVITNAQTSAQQYVTNTLKERPQKLIIQENIALFNQNDFQQKSLSPTIDIRKNQLMTIQETSFNSGQVQQQSTSLANNKNKQNNKNINKFVLNINKDLNIQQQTIIQSSNLPQSQLTSDQNSNAANTNNTNSPKVLNQSGLILQNININNAQHTNAQNSQSNSGVNTKTNQKSMQGHTNKNYNQLQFPQANNSIGQAFAYSKFNQQQQQQQQNYQSQQTNYQMRKKSTTTSSMINSLQNANQHGGGSMSRSRIKPKQIFQQNEKILLEIINRFKQLKGVNTIKGMLLLDKKQIKQFFNKTLTTAKDQNQGITGQQQNPGQVDSSNQVLQTNNSQVGVTTNSTISSQINSSISGFYKNCQGVKELLNAFLDHMFKDRQRMDLDQYKQYFFDELASENPQVLMETAFSYFENLATKKQSQQSNSNQDLNINFIRSPTAATLTNHQMYLNKQMILKTSSSPIQNEKNYQIQLQYKQQQSNRSLTDVDLYKIIELPCFNLLYDDVSAIVRGINLIKQSKSLLQSDQQQNFLSFQQQQSQVQQQQSMMGTVTQNSSPAKIRLSHLGSKPKSLASGGPGGFSLGLNTVRNSSAIRISNNINGNQSERPYTTQGSAIGFEGDQVDEKAQSIARRYSKNWYLTGQDRNKLSNTLLNLREGRCMSLNSERRAQTAQNKSTTNRNIKRESTISKVHLNLKDLTCQQNDLQFLDNNDRRQMLQTAQTSRTHIKLSSVLFSQCAKQSYTKFDSLQQNTQNGFNTERNVKTSSLDKRKNADQDDKPEYCACDWEIKKPEKSQNVNKNLQSTTESKFTKFQLTRPKSMSSLQRYQQTGDDLSKPQRLMLNHTQSNFKSQATQKINAWQFPERESKITLPEYLKKVKFFHNSGTPDIILLAIQLLYGENTLNLFMQMILGMELQNFQIEKWPMFQRKTYDRKAQILQDLATQKEDKTEIIVIRRDFSKFLTTKIFRIGVLNMLKDFHETPHGTISYYYIPDKLGNKLNSEIDPQFITKVQILFTQLCDPRLNCAGGAGITLPYFISQSNLIFGKHQPMLAERIYRYLEYKQQLFLMEYVNNFNNLNNFQSHATAHIEYQVFLDFCFDCQRKTKIPFDTLNITFWLYAQDSTTSIVCKDLLRITQSENWNIISEEFEQEINMLLKYILAKGKGFQYRIINGDQSLNIQGFNERTLWRQLQSTTTAVDQQINRPSH